MKNNYTHIEVILDQSGSMLGRKADVIGGFNRFIQDQRSVNGECTVSLTLFSDNYHPIYSMKPLKDVPELTAQTYRPGGNTSLLYTMIKVIDGLGAQLSSMPEDQRPDRVIVLTLTDGEENNSFIYEPQMLALNTSRQPQPITAIQSHFLTVAGPITPALHPAPQPQLVLNPTRLYDSTALLNRIKEQTDVYSWTFVYLGANHDAFAAGATMGYSMSNTLNYAATAKGFSDAFTSTSSNLKDVRTMTRAAYEGKSKAFFVDADQAVQDANLAVAGAANH